MSYQVEKSSSYTEKEKQNDCSSQLTRSGTDINVDSDTQDPTKAWSKYKNRCKVINVTPLAHNTPISADNVRFVCLSDTHSQIEKTPHIVPGGDVLLHAGDFTNIGLQKEVEKFNKFLEKLPHKHKVVIAGNMDGIFEEGMSSQTVHSETGPAVARKLLNSCVYLQDSTVEIYGIKIYGSPWQPEFCDLAFNLPRGEKLLQKWNKIPEDTDILLTHGPPLGYGDSPRSGGHVGCVELLNTVQNRVRPSYHVYGHIHEGYGMRSDDRTFFINASHMNRDEPINPPIIFDFPLPQGFPPAFEDIKELLVNMEYFEVVGDQQMFGGS